ncbi:MAG: FHA domain-containing protein [Bacteroidales bacterium]|nr:FHA domain-containing protein [Bacteroidales bacterium]
MENQPAGWLILHTEGKETASYELHTGKNRIGRVASTNKPDIPVADDMYVSRNHAVLVVRINDRNQYEYLIADNAEVQGKPSMNGTYINGDTTRLDDKPLKLNDGDTIQVGVTKFVLKTADVAITVDDAVKLTQKLGYTETVDVFKPGVVLRKRV